MFKRPLSFRRSLILNLTFLLVLLGITMLATEFFASRYIIERLANLEAADAIGTVEARNAQFVDPINVLIEVTAYNVRKGLFRGMQFPVELDSYLQGFIESIPQLSSVSVAKTNGDSYLLLRLGDEWKSRISRPQTWGKQTRWREWTDKDPARRESWHEVDYDVRLRPWYKSALAQIVEKGANAPIRQLIHWTRPYEFFTTKQPGVTASVAVDAPDGTRYVLGLDILLEDISKYTTTLRVGQSGMVFVLDGEPGRKDTVLVGLPSDERFKRTAEFQKYILRPPRELGGPVADFAAHVAQLEQADQDAPVPFVSHGKKWWGMIRRWDIVTERPLWVGMVEAEEDLLRQIPDLRAPVIGAIALFVLLAVIRGVRLARTFSEPMDGLVKQGERMQRLNFQPSEPVRSNIVEIRLLAATLERMRQALYSFSSVREDIRIAHSIRRAILPAPLPAAPGFEIEAWSEPSSEVGGEAYDVVDFWANRQNSNKAAGPPDGIALFIFDAAGLGVNTAVKGSQLRAIFRTGVRLGVELPVLAEQMNQYLRNDALDDSPVRSWYGQLNRSNSQLTSLCLGQEPVLRYIAAKHTFEHLDTASRSLGFEDHVVTIPTQSIQLAHGDIIVIASDGVVDTLSAERDKFGVERIKKIILAHRQADAKQILEKLQQALTDFAAGSPADDDRTVVLIKCI